MKQPPDFAVANSGYLFILWYKVLLPYVTKFPSVPILLKKISFSFLPLFLFLFFSKWDSGPAKWILKWRGRVILKSIVGHHGWPTKKILNSRRSRMAKAVTFWPWWQPFNSFCFETLSLFLCFPLFLLLPKNVVTTLPGHDPTQPFPTLPYPALPVSPALDIEVISNDVSTAFQIHSKGRKIIRKGSRYYEASRKE